MRGNKMMTHPESQLFLDGTVLFRENEPGDYAYYIEDGTIELMSMMHGKELVLAILGPGDMVGEMALLDSHPRTATAYVRGYARVIRIHPTQVLDRLRHTDPLIALVLKAVLQRFRDMRERFHLVRGDEQIRILQKTNSSQESISYMTESKRAAHDIKSEIRLKEAFENHELELFVQPIVILSSRRMVGAEALLRWRDPIHGLLGPEDIIALAERTGLIVDVGYRLIEQGCAALVTLDEQFSAPQALDPLHFISINVSPRQLQEADFVERVRRILQGSGIDPQRIKLEITESMMLEQPLLMQARLQALEALGVRIALDDFGTGYSSLSLLMDSSVDTLKIDRSFVMRMTQERKALNIVKAILSLANNLGFDVIAEGIELPEQAELLDRLGCTNGQGYLFAKPLPLHELVATGWQGAG